MIATRQTNLDALMRQAFTGCPSPTADDELADASVKLACEVEDAITKLTRLENGLFDALHAIKIADEHERLTQTETLQLLVYAQAFVGAALGLNHSVGKLRLAA